MPRAFERLYYTILILFAAALAITPVVVQLSFALLGFDQSLREAYSVESFQAWRATAPLRRGFGYGLVGTAVVLIALSIAALVLRVRRRRGIPWMVSAAAICVASVVGLLMFVGLITPTGICC